MNEKLSELRKKNNLTQEELAEKLNVSRQTISKWELGESCPDFDKIVPLCEVFNITTEELLRDKKEIVQSENTQKVDVIKAVLICVSIFFYFIAIIATVVAEEFLHLNDGLVAATFLTLSAIATIILVFTLLTRRNNKEVEFNEVKEEFKMERVNPVFKSIISVLALIFTIIYLVVSFTTGAWHVTWFLWLIYAAGVQIIRLVFILKGKNVDE
jgi:transcriptional regulator with XRE-family HTH domain